jgi:hypothetical protein
MNKQKLGLGLYWIAILWAFLWGIIGSIFVDSAFRNLTMDELNLTMWAQQGPWTMIWALFGVPLAAIVAAIGVLIYSGAKGSTVLKYGIGIPLIIFIGLAAGSIGHIPVLFGIGGTLILLCFTGILWLWAKERMAIKDGHTTAADLKMVGYVFMLIAAWFICGIASQPYLKALDEVSLSSPIHVMIFLVLGWIFLFLGHHKSRIL